MPHDQLFKDLLRTFLPEFMQLFYPQAAARLDFTRVEFLDKEVFADLGEGGKHEADLVAKVALKEGGEEVILIHVEVEAQRRGGFPARMFDYYSLLRLRYRKPIYPVTIYLSPGAGGLVRETYQESTLGETVLQFTYHAVGLPDLSADAYLNKGNPLAPALAALMQPSRLGKALQKARSLQQVVGEPTDEARKLLLLTVVERYIVLDEAEQAELQEIARQSGMAEVDEVLNIFEEREERGYERGIAQGIEQGIQEGLRQGVVRGKRDMLVKMLATRFGSLANSVAESVNRIESEEELDRLSERVLTAPSLDAVGLPRP